MNKSHNYIELNNGVKIPNIAFGVGRINGLTTKDITVEAINSGFRLIDSARAVWGMFSGATIFRKSIFDIIGLFDEKMRLNTGEAIIIQDKMNEHNLIMKKIEFIATNRRIHDNNFGIINQKKEYQDYASVLRAKMAKK